LKIPFDLSVIGFGDIYPSSLATPPLTTIRINLDLIIENAFRIINKLIKNPNQKTINETINTELIIRNSVFRHFDNSNC